MTDEDREVRESVGECTEAADHEIGPGGTCVHCGAEFIDDDDEDPA